MTQVLTKYDKYRSDFEDFERRLSSNGGAGWVHEVRRRAMSSFNRLGMPTATHGNEEWKYTNVNAIANNVFDYAVSPRHVSVDEVRSLAPWNEEWSNLVFVDGRYVPELSTRQADAGGLQALDLSEAVVSHRDLVEKHLATLADYDEDGFTALNTAFVRDGAFVYVPAGEEIASPVHLVFITSQRPRPTVSYPRILMVLGDNSRLKVVESYIGLSEDVYFTNGVAEIVVGEGAALEHHKFLLESQASFHIGSTRVYQGRDSAFSWMSFARGSAIARNRIHVQLDAPGSSCKLRGLYMTSGGQHIDNNLNIDHAKPHTNSDLYFKGILAGRSHAVFSGRVLVQKDAQKANAVQRDKNLILSEGAEVDSKPSLEIYADDVQCSHGATAGAVAEEALFYMRSRGVDEDEATLFLIQGFAGEILDGIQLEPFRAHLERLISGALPSFQFGGNS